MGKPAPWAPSRIRISTLLGVCALHVALIWWVLSVRLPVAAAAGGGGEPLEILYLRSQTRLPVRVDMAHSSHLSASQAVGLAPPDFNSPSPGTTGTGQDGRDSSVNWAAEAHRAVRAYEIRRDAIPSAALSVSTTDDGWWFTKPHHPGDRFKTESGDWIVWVDASCYQVASWHAGAPDVSVEHPRTFCAGDPKSVQRESGDTSAPGSARSAQQ